MEQFRGDGFERDRLRVAAPVEGVADGPQASGKWVAPRRNRPQPSCVDPRHGSEQAAVAVGHRPRRDPLVEIGGHHADQQGMHEGIGVERWSDGEDQVAVPDRRR